MVWFVNLFVQTMLWLLRIPTRAERREHAADLRGTAHPGARRWQLRSRQAPQHPAQPVRPRGTVGRRRDDAARPHRSARRRTAEGGGARSASHLLSQQAPGPRRRHQPHRSVCCTCASSCTCSPARNSRSTRCARRSFRPTSFRAARRCSSNSSCSRTTSSGSGSWSTNTAKSRDWSRSRTSSRRSSASSRPRRRERVHAACAGTRKDRHSSTAPPACAT